MSSPLKQNTTTIQELLNTINSLPEAGGVELPELSNPATAEEVFLNKEFIDEDGNSVTGTFSIDDELSNQDNLISQIQTALQNKSAATGEDVTSETTAYTNKLATLETAITALETELQGKASGGSGGGGSVETCTVTTTGLNQLAVTGTSIDNTTGEATTFFANTVSDGDLSSYKFLKGSPIIFMDKYWETMFEGVAYTGAEFLNINMQGGAAVFKLTSDTATFTFTH